MAQLLAVCTAVCREHSCLHGTQLSSGYTVVSRLSQRSHGTELAAWHAAWPGAQLS